MGKMNAIKFVTSKIREVRPGAVTQTWLTLIGKIEIDYKFIIYQNRILGALQLFIILLTIFQYDCRLVLRSVNLFPKLL